MLCALATAFRVCQSSILDERHGCLNVRETCQLSFPFSYKLHGHEEEGCALHDFKKTHRFYEDLDCDTRITEVESLCTEDCSYRGWKNCSLNYQFRARVITCKGCLVSICADWRPGHTSPHFLIPPTDLWR